MERLPDELLSDVLRRLALAELLAAARVCRRWAALVRARLLVVRRRADAGRARPALRRLLVTARGVALAPLLGAARGLRELTLHARAALAPAELRALERLPQLRHLDVFAARRVLGAAALPAARRLAALVLNDTAAPGLLRALGAAGRLEALHMYGRAQHFPPRELGALLAARRLRLTELTLRCAELPDAAYAAIGACEALVALRLYSCWLLRARGAARLARLERLRVLHVTGARMVRARALHALLAALPAGLGELSLSAGWFGAGHAAALGARLPALRSLELWRCGLSARDVLALAAALPALCELDVDAALGAGELRALAAHGALRRLRCSLPAGARAGAGAAGGRVCLRAAGAAESAGTLRGGGEGPRADQFYSWGGAGGGGWGEGGGGGLPPALSEDEEEDRALLGPLGPEDLSYSDELPDQRHDMSS